jgi:hypothetical protein
MVMIISRRAFGVGLLFVSLACSAGSPSPVVDSITVDSTTKDATGQYTSQITVAAHGSGSAISSLTIHIPVQNGVNIADGNPISVAGFASPYPIKLVFPLGTPPGTYTFQVAVIDASGARSAPLGSTLTLP